MVFRKINSGVLELRDSNNVVILSVKEQYKDDCFYVTLSGQLKTEVAHDFEDELMAALSVCSKIVLNLERVDYIASMAMKALLSVQQMMDNINGASLTLVRVSAAVMNTLNEYGFTDMLQIEDQTSEVRFYG